MVAKREFIKRVLTSITDAFTKAGWTKRDPRTFSLDVSGEVFGTVYLNTAIGRGQGIFEVNPIVGVSSYRLETLVSELLAINSKPCTTATIDANVGYLMPENRYRPWLFHEDEDCEAMVSDLVATVNKYGRPYMSANATLDRLYHSLCQSSRDVSGLPQYSIPAACVLRGRPNEAIAFLDMRLKQIAPRTDAAAKTFRTFATKLRTYIAEGRIT